MSEISKAEIKKKGDETAFVSLQVAIDITEIVPDWIMGSFCSFRFNFFT